jgi:hypothetical protein
MSTSNLLIAFFVAAAFFTLSDTSEAAQRTVVSPDGKTHVVHDELGPVLMHRVFPPYKGIHIHSSELQRMNSSGRRR